VTAYSAYLAEERERLEKELASASRELRERVEKMSEVPATT
jgi:hypothetical protein